LWLLVVAVVELL
jgi:hypothetical protein